MINNEKETWIKIPLAKTHIRPDSIIAISNRGRMMLKNGKIEIMPYRQRISVDGIRIRAYRYLASVFIPRSEDDILHNRNCIDHITHKPNNMFINDIRNMRWCTTYENNTFEEKRKNNSIAGKSKVALAIEAHYGKDINEIRKQYDYDRWYYYHKGHKFPWEE